MELESVSLSILGRGEGGASVTFIDARIPISQG